MSASDELPSPDVVPSEALPVSLLAHAASANTISSARTRSDNFSCSCPYTPKKIFMVTEAHPVIPAHFLKAAGFVTHKSRNRA